MTPKSLLLEVAKTVEQHRREEWGWRYDGLEPWPNEKIFAQLCDLGIDTNADRFHQQALAAGRMKVLEDEWDSQLREEKKASGFWEDFPMLAVPVLWERLAGDLICPELIDHRLHRVLEAEEDDTPLEGSSASKSLANLQQMLADQSRRPAQDK